MVDERKRPDSITFLLAILLGVGLGVSLSVGIYLLAFRHRDVERRMDVRTAREATHDP